ncbi:alcohol oxidase [Gloeophyllum trabeum ATCC 11539]|uniref:Alcohol oxidase n=1 Tax=Gloeophyllum trabeum (strain ATCC 11539 / FP-39264 / Madison 617) TaxID=670483 RepID=S7Q1P4_GLOTA|nr:alcohol oxidase [Gloeophyllum trabeum ATCC 11539]EPQ53452.1 alcohol oxidase [Gloeophyllum trabeum ATCC 11539]
MVANIEDVADKSFDYIVIGGGTSGLCVAARLSEDPTVSVLVLEAGNANLDDPLLLRPASYGSHFENPAYDWAFKTTPQKYCNGTQFTWNRGKGLGGSSAINFLCWTKPPAAEIDDIERLGNPGWNWKNYETFSHRTETCIYPSEEVIKKHGLRIEDWKNGTEGPLLTSFPAKINAAELDIQQTLINRGLPLAKKPLGGDPLGVFFGTNTVDPKTSTRTYATTAFYLPNVNRPNFTVLVQAPVNRLLTTKDSNGLVIAVGVEFRHNGRDYSVRPNKEVVLCAGGLKSSQILELSGFGNPQLLKSLDIPVVLPLSTIGENVQEHIFTGVTWELREDASFDTLDVLRDPKIAAEHVELHAKGEGLFTMGLCGFAFVPLQMLSKRADDIHKAARDKIEKNAAKYPSGLLEQYRIQLERLERGAPGCEYITFPGFLSQPNPPKPGKKYLTMLVLTNHLFSRGTIHVKSKNPEDDPEFDPHYFEEEIDRDTFVEIVKFAKGLAQTAPFKDLVAQEVNPGPEVTTDEQIADWLKSYMTTTYHTIGSCSMLPKDKGGVVDSKLKVYGTTNVRVADLSVIPLHFAAHPQATAYAIGEQAADIIKGVL